MLILYIALIASFCCALAACSYLYATHKANARLIRRQDREKARLERTNIVLLDRVLQRHGSAPISTPTERPGPAQSFVPSDAWEEHWGELDEYDAQRVAALYGPDATDLTDAQKEELRRRVEQASRGDAEP